MRNDDSVTRLLDLAKAVYIVFHCHFCLNKVTYSISLKLLIFNQKPKNKLNDFPALLTIFQAVNNDYSKTVAIRTVGSW